MNNSFTKKIVAQESEVSDRSVPTQFLLQASLLGSSKMKKKIKRIIFGFSKCKKIYYFLVITKFKILLKRQEKSYYHQI